MPPSWKVTERCSTTPRTPTLDAGGDALYVSTGHLPSSEQVQQWVDEAHHCHASVSDGRNADVYPALEHVPSELFGVCAAGTSGSVYAAGDTEHPFTIMSAAKPFVFAVVRQARPDESRRLLGVNATGMPFNSLTAVERSTDGRTNPMVNAGAIASTSLVPGGHVEEKWQFLIDRLSRFAGRPLLLDEEVYASASSTNHRNRGIANLLESYGRVYCDPSSATDLYTRQSCVAVTATDLATMGATLADGGVNLKTRERVVDAAICHRHARRHDDRGHVRELRRLVVRRRRSGQERDWRWHRRCFAGQGRYRNVCATTRHAAGNSVRGQLAARFLSRRLGPSLFVSAPEA